MLCFFHALRLPVANLEFSILFNVVGDLEGRGLKQAALVHRGRIEAGGV